MNKKKKKCSNPNCKFGQINTQYSPDTCPICKGKGTENNLLKKKQTINKHYQEVEVEERFNEDQALLSLSQDLLSPNRQ